MPRIILDSIGTIGLRGFGASRVSMYAKRIIDDEGPQVVSMDSDGKVYATPRDHTFSRSLLSPKYVDNVVGNYDGSITAKEIQDDMLALHVAQRAVA